MSRNRWHPAKVICDTDFADDIVPLSNILEQAQLLLSRAETFAKQIGLQIHNSKTEYIKFSGGEGDLKALNGESLKNVDDFFYPGSWIDRSSKDVNALHKLDTLWKSELPGCVWRLDFFQGNGWNGPPVWIDGLNTDTVFTQKVRRDIQMLRVVKNVTWLERITNEVPCAEIPRVSITVRDRRLRLSGHCWRSKNEVVSDLVFVGKGAL